MRVEGSDVHHRFVRFSCAVAVVALAAAGCTSGEPGGAASASRSPSASTSTSAGRSATPTGPRAGGSLRYALSTDPEYIDPGLVADEQGEVVVDALFDSLVALDQNMDVVPAAASDWEVNEDATVFTFHLEQGATFHDGEPVAASDFVRAFNRMADGTRSPASFIAYQLAPIKGFPDAQQSGKAMSGLEAPDANTLTITLEHPFAEFPKVLADPSLGPVPPAADSDPEGFAQKPIGNGPFQMAEPWQHDQFIRVNRFDDYYGNPALLDEVVFQIYPDDVGADRQYGDFTNGQLQVAEVPPSKTDSAREEYGVSTDGYRGPGVIDGLTSTLYYYGFNVEQPPFDNPKVRQAISELIDRDAIANDIMKGTREPADAIVPPSIPGHQDGVCTYCRYDPEDAKKLVEDVEFPESIRILFNTGESHEAIATKIAADIEAALGVKVETSGEELQPFVQTLREGKMDIFRLGWQADYPSPGAYLLPLFSSGTIGQDNLTRFSDPEVDAKLAEARGTKDDAVRLRLYQEVEQRVLHHAAIAPILYYRFNRVVAPEVRGFRISPLGNVDLSRIWLAAK